MNLPKWAKGWIALTGRTDKKRSDGTDLRYIPSVQFGPDPYWSSVIHVPSTLDNHEQAIVLIAAAPAYAVAWAMVPEEIRERVLAAAEPWVGKTLDSLMMEQPWTRGE